MINTLILAGFLTALAMVTIPVLGYLGLAAFTVHRTGDTSGLPEIGRQVAAIVNAGRIRFRRRSSPK